MDADSELDSILTDVDSSSEDIEASSQKVEVAGMPSSKGHKNQVKEDFNLLPFFTRLLYRIIAFFTNKDPHKVMKDRKLKELKHRLLSSRPPVLLKRDSLIYISRHVAYELYNIYRDLKKIQIIEDSLVNPKLMNNFYKDIFIYTKSNNIRTDIREYINDEKFWSIFQRPNTLNSELNKIKMRIENQAKHLPKDFINNIVKTITPLYMLKELLVFDYNPTWLAFGVSDFTQRSSDLVDSPLDSSRDIIENLCSLIQINTIQINGDILNKFFINYHIVKYRGENRENLQKEANLFLKQANYTIEKWNTYIIKNKLMDILRFTYKDTYYNPRTTDYFSKMVQVEVVEQLGKSYISYMNNKLEDKFIEIKDRYMATLQRNLIHKLDESLLTNYIERTYVDSSASKKLTWFKYVNSINLSYNFMTKCFRTEILDNLLKIIHSFFSDQSELPTTADNLNIQYDRIINSIITLDHSLRRDSSRGQMLLELTINTERGNESSQSELLKLTKNIDNEILEILRNLSSYLNTCYVLISHIRNERSVSAFIRNINNIYSPISEEYTIKELVGRIIQTLNEFNYFIASNLAKETSLIIFQPRG